MCEPTTLAVVGGIAAVASAGAQGAASVQAGNYQAAVAKQNAGYARSRQADALNRGQQVAAEVNAEGAAVAGGAEAAMAGNNIDASSGSAANMFAATAMNVAADVETAKSNAAREAWGYKVEEENFNAEARNARRRGILGAVTAGLGGAAGAANAFGRYKYGG